LKNFGFVNLKNGDLKKKKKLDTVKNHKRREKDGHLDIY